MQRQIIECVPNFSEGRDPVVIRAITAEITRVPGVKLLHVDPGKGAHRTVVSFAGDPEHVATAAFLAIRKAAELIDMRHHQGAHPRMGATDVCPLIPVSGITMEAVAGYARRLAKRVGEELQIPVYLYEYAATTENRKNLADIRRGGYEGLEARFSDPAWRPDYGAAVFNPRSGATAIGARDFLVAYNVNLDTTSVRLANAVAFDVREKGRIKRTDGRILLDTGGHPLRTPGLLKAVKAIGWFIEEYGIAQVSMNLTDLKTTPLHLAFEACSESARKRGMRVTGSELVGLIPLQSLLDAGRYFLAEQQRYSGLSDKELITAAVRYLGLDELAPFDPREKVIEYVMSPDR
jgi:glutamate formiminotransferase/formiminotetrahydrofolate cyclodeaminase